MVARARRWRKPLVVHPQFTEPEFALRANGHVVTRLILDQEDGLPSAAEVLTTEHDASLAEDDVTLTSFELDYDTRMT